MSTSGDTSGSSGGSRDDGSGGADDAAPPGGDADAAPDHAPDAARDAALAAAAPDRRTAPVYGPVDRRTRPTPWMSRYWLRGRRRGSRRAGDPAEIFVDRYERRDWMPVLAILVACVVDLVLTLDYLRRGGEEWNPVMAQALQHGDGVFIVAKLGLTTVCMLFLLVRIHFRGVRRAVKLLLAAYLLLMAWHGVVRFSLPDEAEGPVAALASGTSGKPAATDEASSGGVRPAGAMSAGALSPAATSAGARADGDVTGAPAREEKQR